MSLRSENTIPVTSLKAREIRERLARDAVEAKALALRDDIAWLVCQRCTVTLEMMGSGSRAEAVTYPRMLLWWCWHRVGMTMATITRQFTHTYDHSTINHGIGVIDGMKEWRLAGEAIVGMVTQNNAARICAGLPVEVASYLRCVLADRPVTLSGLVGLHMLASDPALRGRVGTRLAAHAETRQLWRIRQHARQAGMRWMV